MNWKDNETGSIGTEIICDTEIKHVIEYNRYYECYRLTVYIDGESYDQLTDFDSIQDAKDFSYGYNIGLHSAFVHVRRKISFLFN